MPRIQDAAGAAGYDLEVINDPANIGAEGSFTGRAIPLTEPLEGPDAQLVRHLTESRPALIIVDLNSNALPWARWIQVIKTSAATRRIPILAFGPHVETEKFAAARSAGADAVVSRGTFQNKLRDLLAQYALPSIHSDLLQACEGKLSLRAMDGIALHNKMQFFEAHEQLELAWMEAPEHEGYLYRALLQISVAYLHLERDNLRGASKMLLRVRQWLDPLPDTCRGVDIQELRDAAEHLRTALDQAFNNGERPSIDDLFQPVRTKD